MNAVLIALFVSASAQGLPASGGAVQAAPPPRSDVAIDAPAAPVRSLAGRAKQLDAVVELEFAPALTELERPAVHSTGEKKPMFNPAAKRPIA